MSILGEQGKIFTTSRPDLGKTMLSSKLFRLGMFKAISFKASRHKYSFESSVSKKSGKILSIFYPDLYKIN